MFASRSAKPITISTTGPANDLDCRRGGGGACTVLAIVHLARRWWLNLAGCNPSRRVRWSNMSFGRRAAVHDLDYSDHNQQKRPGAVPSDAADTIEQREHADGDQYCRSHEPAAAAAIAVICALVAQVAPPLREQPPT